MRGPEHYREAELLLETTDETVHSPETVANRLAQAQVHATLALAAATAATRCVTPQESWGGHTLFVDGPEWREATA